MVNVPCGFLIQVGEYSSLCRLGYPNYCKGWIVSKHKRQGREQPEEKIERKLLWRPSKMHRYPTLGPLSWSISSLSSFILLSAEELLGVAQDKTIGGGYSAGFGPCFQLPGLFGYRFFEPKPFARTPRRCIGDRANRAKRRPLPFLPTDVWINRIPVSGPSSDFSFFLHFLTTMLYCPLLDVRESITIGPGKYVVCFLGTY